ncbi:hypothetical protein HAX54_033178 [Datura stramonium]|uniref:Uncharacterized protein n=1 Tax=Datura stramonium TaxID=4076 RepID=A0ABS8VDG7_DATST|nr:hypothetical protein [Datura stramonium]
MTGKRAGEGHGNYQLHSQIYLISLFREVELEILKKCRELRLGHDCAQPITQQDPKKKKSQRQVWQPKKLQIPCEKPEIPHEDKTIHIHEEKTKEPWQVVKGKGTITSGESPSYARITSIPVKNGFTSLASDETTISKAPPSEGGFPQ